ncbi:MAG: prepilin peptidase, partial [bacterium]|nr:prepilin peptidase [bacterium]
MIPLIILSVLGGLIYGSFLNVLLWRLPEGNGIGGRSHCRACHHQLTWYDLIPVLSFIILRGRCRYCHASIHIRYPVVETSTAIVLVLFFALRQPPLGLESIITVFALLVLVSLLFFDLFYLILPDVILLPTIVVFAVYDVTK